MSDFKLKPLNKNPDLNKIAITGKIRSGKDEVARYLNLHHEYSHYKFSYLITKHLIELYPEKDLSRKQRSLYQWYGQMVRSVDKDVLVNAVFRRIANDYFMDQVKKIVISDLRQPNEYNRLIDENFTILRVNSDRQLREYRAKQYDEFNSKDFDHETEQYVDLFPVHYDLYNNGTLDDLFTQVERIINSSHSPA